LADYYESSDGHSALFEALYAISGVSDVDLKAANFGKFHSVGVGRQSLYLAVTFPAMPAAVAAGIVYVRVGDVTESLTIVAIGSPLADSVSIGLARRVAAHIASQLAVAGSSSAAG
jgi:uncharacterized membrane protein